MGMTKSQGTILARLIAELRPEWDFHGVLAAVGRAAPRGSEFDVAIAAIYAAADPFAKTPGFIAENGPHWDAIAALPREDAAYVHHRRTEAVAHRRVLDQVRADAAAADPDGSHRGYQAAVQALRATA